MRSRDNDSTIEAVQSYEVDDPWFFRKHDAGCGVEESRVKKHLKQELHAIITSRNIGEFQVHRNKTGIAQGTCSMEMQLKIIRIEQAAHIALLLNHIITLFMPNEDKTCGNLQVSRNKETALAL